MKGVECVPSNFSNPILEKVEGILTTIFISIAISV